MSHWISGKLSLVCSLEQMRNALVNIMPQWERHIQVSEEGNLDINSSFANDTKGGFHIRVPETSTPGVSYCDFGMKRLKDGSWHIEYDNGGLPKEMKKAPTVLKNQIGAMRMREISKQNGIDIIEENKIGSVIKQRIRMSVSQVNEFVQQIQ